MSRSTRLVVLCEDLQQEVFAREYLQERGFERQRVRYIRSPKGTGAGEQYVRNRYSKEVGAHRRRAATQRDVALAVMIDADHATVSNRLGQLDEALTDAQLSPRQQNERIAIFVPKRNIETWLHHLQDESVDEETIYAKFHRESDCKPLARKLVRDICPNELPEDTPPSLKAACDEIVRIM